LAEHQLFAHSDRLAQLFEKSLRTTLFSSRAYLRPSQVTRLASTQAEAFFDYLQQPDPVRAQSAGVELCRVGAGSQAVLQIGQCLVQFCMQYGQDSTCLGCVETVQAFHGAVMQGYLNVHDANILEEQERIRSALQQTLHRYTLQLETAAEVARTAISTLELGTLLTTAVDLIGERFGLDYVAIYLLDEDDRYAELRAATGLEGRVRLASRHRLKAYGASTVGKCLASKRHLLVMARSEESAGHGASWLADTQSEIVLPLITHNKVIGALSAQSKRSGAFSSQDVTGFQIMSDQLANAIENARLYADAQRRAEDLAQAYEQLKELEVLKDQFMQNVSHELRTPLTMIRGYAEYMLGGEMGAVDADQQEALHVILRNSEALSELVADILAMLEISATKTALTAISLVETVRDSVASFQIVAAKNGVVLNAELPAANGCCLVMARTDHLRRITDNLLSNALKFTPAGGQVSVRLREGEHRVHLEVADTGIGILPHLQERIFERFFQADSSQRRVHGGAGLGLALVKELVESYGGSVSAVSPGKDQGSTLTVTLPRAVT
jgi:signal transduction histidine kinase